jgi:hypothetical protein
MGTKDIQTAFNLAAAGKAVCTEAKLTYVDGAQVITLIGHDGVEAFEIQSDPFHGCPSRQASKLALDMRAKQDPEYFMGLLPPIDYQQETKMKTNRTGFGTIGALMDQMRDDLQKGAHEIHNEIQGVVDDGKTLVADYKQAAKEAKQEIAEARAGLGTITNGGPALDSE